MAKGMQWMWFYTIDGLDSRGRPTKKTMSCETAQHGGVATWVQFVTPKNYQKGKCYCEQLPQL